MVKVHGNPNTRYNVNAQGFQLTKFFCWNLMGSKKDVTTTRLANFLPAREAWAFWHCSGLANSTKIYRKEEKKIILSTNPFSLPGTFMKQSKYPWYTFFAFVHALKYNITNNQTICTNPYLSTARDLHSANWSRNFHAHDWAVLGAFITNILHNAWGWERLK